MKVSGRIPHAGLMHPNLRITDPGGDDDVPLVDGRGRKIGRVLAVKSDGGDLVIEAEVNDNLVAYLVAAEATRGLRPS